MSDYNGKQLCGYTVENDPDLMAPTWSTRNFEFSCIRPETVQRAIDKVQSDVGASLKQRKSHLLSKLRERGGESTFFPTHFSRDTDVESRLSHVHSDFDHMNFDKEKGYTSGRSSPSPRSFSVDLPRQIPPFPAQRVEGNIQSSMPAPPPGFKALSSPRSAKQHRIVIEEYPTPKWVEIEEPQLRTMQIFDVKELPFIAQQQRQQLQYMPPHQYPYGMPGMPGMNYPYLPPPPPAQILQATGFVYNPPHMVGQMSYQDVYTTDDPRSYLLEDSDLDDEMLQRQHYTRYCQDRPTADEMQPSDENDGRAEFVKIDPKEPYTDMSYLKSTAPMRYSEMSDEEILQEYKDHSPRITIKKRGEASKSEQEKPKQKKEKSANAKARSRTLAQLIAEEKMLESQRNQLGKVSFKKPTTTRKQAASPAVPPQTQQQQHAQKLKHPLTSRAKQTPPPPIATSPRNAANTKAPMITAAGKSLEQLKAEKVSIFNKMSRTHERIILALETLREKLLEVHEPESTSDRNRRNRNGFEFSVRFLRNFLYPLKGMIDTMRNTTKEQFNSAASNDACNRVAHIYSLFLQAILTYSKQLRHFMIDQVPQKLTTLLEMLFSTTNICLDKRLFDRNDPLVDCMLKHCKTFLHFMEDLHARRFVAARESYRKNSEAPEAKFNLKMFMNDLNMYEPKLVPKKSSHMRIKASNYKPGFNGAGAVIKAGQLPTAQHTRRKRGKAPKQRLEAGRGVASEPSATTIHKQLDDVQTQMQACGQIRTSELDYRQSREMLNLQKLLENNSDVDRNEKIEVINRAIVDALQSVEHDQASEVLKPLLETINAALDLPDNAECIEKILKAFQINNSKTLNEKKIVYEERRSEGYCLSRNVSRTKLQRSHTSTKRHENDINKQQKHQRQKSFDERCSGDYKHHGNVDEGSEGDVDADEHGDHNHGGGDRSDDEGSSSASSDRSDYESPTNEFDEHEDYSDNNNDDNNATVDYVYNAPSEEYDEDAQFYVSGEDCDNYHNANKHYRRNIILNGKKKLEPLVEYADENADNNEADDRSASSNILNKQKRSISNPPKRSPYENRVYRKKSTQSITTPTVIPQTKKSAAAAAAARSLRQQQQQQQQVTTATNLKFKQTTTPPSPAMSRLKQRTQPATAERIKKANLLKKHSRRNPMGSPPPVPAVSPSTSSPNTPSINISDMHLSLNSAVMTHKGVSTNDRLNEVNRIKAADNGPLDNNFDDDDEDTFRAEKIEFTEVSRTDCKKDIRSYSDGNELQAVSLPFSENIFICSKNTPLTLYTGTNPYPELTSARRSSGANSSSSNNHKNQNDAFEKAKDKSSKVDFDESGLLLERDQHLSLCLRNPLYSNPKFLRPWKMFMRLSEKLTEEVLQAVQSDFANGVEAFVDDFLHLETTI